MPTNKGESQVKYLRDRADECRVIAELLKDDKLCLDYLKLADSYAALAEQESAIQKSRDLLSKSAPDTFLGRAYRP